MSLTTPRTIFGMSMRDDEVTSPATITNPVLVSVSQATRDHLSSLMRASRIASDTRSHNLSEGPSVTLSDVNKYSDIDDSLISQGLKRGGSLPALSPGVNG